MEKCKLEFAATNVPVPQHFLQSPDIIDRILISPFWRDRQRSRWMSSTLAVYPHLFYSGNNIARRLRTGIFIDHGRREHQCPQAKACSSLQDRVDNEISVYMSRAISFFIYFLCFIIYNQQSSQSSCQTSWRVAEDERSSGRLISLLFKQFRYFLALEVLRTCNLYLFV